MVKRPIAQEGMGYTLHSHALVHRITYIFLTPCLTIFISLTINVDCPTRHERAPNPSRFSKEGLFAPGTEVLLENVRR